MSAIIKDKFVSFCIFFLFVLVNSCYKDKGNYDYTAVNNISISLPDSIIVGQGDIASVNPVLSFAVKEDTADLSYEWVVSVPTGTNNDTSLVVLSTSRDLLDTITYNAGSAYPINFKVTDNKTGIVYRKQMTLYVITEFQPGYFLLEKKSTGADVSFINSETDSIRFNAFSERNQGVTLPNNVRCFRVVDVARYNYTFNSVQTSMPAATNTVLLFEGGGYVLEHKSMKIIADYSSLFITAPSVIDPSFYALDVSPNLATINNGQLHRVFQARSGQSLFSSAYTAPDDKDMYLLPYQGYKSATTGGQFYYDQKNKRFLKEQFLTDQLALITSTNVALSDSVMAIRTFLNMGVGYYSQTLAVFKDSYSDTAYIYSFGGSVFSTALKVLNSPGMAYSPDYVYPTNRFQIYYGYENKLYVYNYLSNKATLVYEFPSGENITKFNLTSNATIAVATYNGTGSLYVFSLLGTGLAQNSTYTKKYTGFGNIVDISYKAL